MVTSHFPHIAQTVSAHQTAEITGEVYIGDNCRLSENTKLRGSEGRLIVGKNTSVGASTRLESKSERTTIGDEVKIGEHCVITGTIGDHTVIGDGVILHSSVRVGSRCIITENQELRDMVIPDNTKVSNGRITSI